MFRKASNNTLDRAIDKKKVIDSKKTINLKRNIGLRKITNPEIG